MILLCEHPAVASGAKVENRFLVFQARSASFAPLRWMRERPIKVAAYSPERMVRATRGLLSIRTISGYAVWVRIIQ